MRNLFSNPWKVLGIFTGLALVMRFFSFFPSVIDHDESTYIIIADAIRQGKIYLKDVTDTKPIGIFTLFALFQTLFGKSVMVIRIITAIWIALTAWMLYLVHRQLVKDAAIPGYNPAPVASGMIYVFITSIFTFYGVSPNTEQFFNLFSVMALLLMLRNKNITWLFIAGLLLGAGFMIKPVVLFDAIALGLFYLWQQVKQGKKWSFWLTRCALMGIGFVIPFALVWLYYIQQGLGDTFWFYTFELSGRYFINPPWYDYVIYVLEFFARFLPVTVWFFFCLWHWRTTGSDLPVLALVWGGLVMIIILLPGKLFGHYLIQFMLPVSLLAGSFFDVRRSPGSALAWMRNPRLGYTLLGLIVLVNLVLQKKDYFDKPDYPRQVADYLNSRLEPGDVIYSGDFHQITYLLTGTQSPTPYIHRSLIWTTYNSQALKIDPAEEWHKILDQNPRFILIEKPVPEGHLSGCLAGV